jgi:nucleotide-binding universal stress UspA family protein
MNLPKHILVPTDFGEPAARALDFAIEMAAELGARVTVLHAYEIPFVGVPDGALVASAEMAASISRSAQETLDKTVGAHRGRALELEAVLVNGDARTTILTVTKELGADLVVMGTHGRRGLAHLLIGSVAEYVVRTAPVPVLTVRSPKST